MSPQSQSHAPSAHPQRAQVVWFKRDLRTHDHEALSAATTAGPTTCLYVLEDDYWQQPATSNRQWRFVRESLLQLHEDLMQYGLLLRLWRGTAVQAFQTMHAQLGPFALHSHEETGNLWTYERDRQVSTWCKAHGLTWRQYPQTGVFRPVQRRGKGFREHWEDWVKQPCFQPPSLHRAKQTERLAASSLVQANAAALPLDIKVDCIPCPNAQTGGRSYGLQALQSFLALRGRHYNSLMSSPHSAQTSCSRLSAYLAYGCLSLREVVHAVDSAQQRTQDSAWRYSLRAYRMRLWWHCYCMQILENTPTVETTTLAKSMELLERPWCADRFAAWQHGRTGWPLVDACMRFLHHHGWINFRMRAMLVTIATCTLSLPWKPVAQWLAQMFVDFEPGIHYPQIQMHSATAAAPVLRIYNPVRQAQQLDPDGQFVRQWVPQLRAVGDSWIFRPWDMPQALRSKCGLEGTMDYPTPCVDFELANRRAKQNITQVRQEHQAQPAPGFNERRRRTAQRAEALCTNTTAPRRQLTLF